ncbi:MAG: hypothetical protein DYG97_16730 [Ignavibacteria bacterium CHB3]|nr:MAG: hypothetical protein EDM72_03735 [Chlorobiota bacterium]MCE7858141.1 hypothetical protein [Ignavibacteria bacterium CHB3]
MMEGLFHFQYFREAKYLFQHLREKSETHRIH